MFPIKEIEKVRQVFPTDVSDLIPVESEIPDEFWNTSNKHSKLISAWFFRGLSPDSEFYPKEGVDAEKAFIHINTVMKSWELKHEYKTAACAFLVSEWFDKVKTDEVEI